MFQQLLFTLLLLDKVGADQCPLASTTKCNCTGGPQVVISCRDLSDSEQLRRILTTVTSQHINNLTVSDSRITELDSSILAGKSFTWIRFFNVTPLKLLTTNFLRDSFQTLSQLSVETYDSVEIRLSGLAGMESLALVELTGGFSRVSDFPALPNLRILHLYGNRYSQFPVLPILQRLQILNSCCGYLNSLGQLQMAMFPVLKKLYLFSNKITSLDEGTFHKASPYLELIDLSDNKIHFIAPTAFEVMGPNLQLKLLRNHISQLDTETFQSLAEQFIKGNPLRCDCSIAWLVRSSALRRAVAEFTCIDSRTYSKLTTAMYRSCP